MQIVAGSWNVEKTKTRIAIWGLMSRADWKAFKGLMYPTNSYCRLCLAQIINHKLYPSLGFEALYKTGSFSLMHLLIPSVFQLMESLQLKIHMR